MTDPAAALSRLQQRIRPGARGQQDHPDPWEPPVFAHYEDIRTWLSESVMSAQMYERFPDGRWTIQLLLKEQDPGRYRYIVL